MTNIKSTSLAQLIDKQQADIMKLHRLMSMDDVPTSENEVGCTSIHWLGIVEDDQKRRRADDIDISLYGTPNEVFKAEFDKFYNAINNKKIECYAIVKSGEAYVFRAFVERINIIGEIVLIIHSVDELKQYSL